ncbi:MAG TPA: four-helix bundle copper-binding protein [Bacteroidia bacterium]|jgi:hypothetical protein
MENKKLIDELHFCAAQCNHCYDACQMEKDKEELKRCMVLDLDCADICRLTAQVLERNSETADLFLKFCAEICEKCAEECDKHSQLEHCKKCAEACHRCAEMCQNPVA